jgi:tetratricopeptide (TPR) repeat protein
MNVADAESEIQRLTSLVKAAKEEAKDLRDDNDMPGAIDVLKDTIARMEESPLAVELVTEGPASEPVRRLATQLADCWGMLGGNYRRLGDLKDAQEAFERGRVYEKSDRLQVDSSYNLVNAITLPLERGHGLRAADLANDLREAVRSIERQVNGKRRTDRWAWADLAECRLLLGERDQALLDYERARDLGDEETTRSIVAVLQRLHSAMRRSDPTTGDDIKEAITRMTNNG